MGSAEQLQWLAESTSFFAALTREEAEEKKIALTSSGKLERVAAYQWVAELDWGWKCLSSRGLSKYIPEEDDKRSVWAREHLAMIEDP